MVKVAVQVQQKTASTSASNDVKGYDAAGTEARFGTASASVAAAPVAAEWWQMELQRRRGNAEFSFWDGARWSAPLHEQKESGDA